MRKAVHIFDLHYPYYSRATFDLILRVIKDEKPTEIIFHGDQIDNEAVSHWLENKPRLLEGKRLKTEYLAFNRQILQPIINANPRAKIVWIMGNHEDWTQQELDKNPRFEGLIEIENILQFKDRDIEIIPLNDFYKFGKLNCIHGFYHNQYHASKTVNAFNSSVIYGHLHTLQVHTKVSELDNNDFHAAYSMPCACNLKLRYNKGKPTKWVNGFAITYLKPDGGFNTYPIIVCKKSLIWNGKFYQSNLPQ